MDAIDSNVRNYLELPPRPAPWQTYQGNRTVFAAVQRSIVAQNAIGWDKFLSGMVSNYWEQAQTVYQEVSKDTKQRKSRTWTSGLLSSLWEFSHEIWMYRNTIKHGATVEEQQRQRRARIVLLVEERYRHRPHLDQRYNFLFRKPLLARLQEGNRALYMWLENVSNLSSISTRRHRQTSIHNHATVERLTEEDKGRLRRPLARLRRASNPICFKVRKGSPKSVLGTQAPSISQLLPALWKFTPQQAPVQLSSKRPRKKRFKHSIRSCAAWLTWDRGRSSAMLN